MKRLYHSTQVPRTAPKASRKIDALGFRADIGRMSKSMAQHVQLVDLQAEQ